MNGSDHQHRPNAGWIDGDVIDYVFEPVNRVAAGSGAVDFGGGSWWWCWLGLAARHSIRPCELARSLAATASAASRPASFEVEAEKLEGPDWAKSIVM